MMEAMNVTQVNKEQIYELNSCLQNLIADVNDLKIQRSNQQPIESHHAIISTNRYDGA